MGDRTVTDQLNPRARIHESVITYDGHISRPGITELKLGPSENSYSRVRKRSVIVVLEVGGFHTGCLVTKRCTAHGRRVISPARVYQGQATFSERGPDETFRSSSWARVTNENTTMILYILSPYNTFIAKQENQ